MTAAEHIDVCAQRLRRFAEQNCRDESPLYEHLCSRTADDPELLRIVCAAPDGQPAPNLFLAAVHFLLLAGSRHELGGFYGSCVAAPRPYRDAFPAFRDFCLQYQDAIRELISRRRVQTNEVRRCAYLLPAFAYVAALEHPRPLALIEVGTSAGLNLIWDRYAYDYGTGGLLGRSTSPVRITTELRGHRRPLLPRDLPVVVQRVGVDLHVPDLSDPAEVLWLRALIWPDQPARRELLNAAIEELRADPPDLIAGDALDLLPSLLRAAPGDATVCVFHCHTLNQFSESQREQFSGLLAEASRQRPVVELSAEWLRTPAPELRLIGYEAGRSRSQHLANVDHHGCWIEWLVDGEEASC